MENLTGPSARAQTPEQAQATDVTGASPDAGADLSPRDAAILDRVRRFPDVVEAGPLRGHPVMDLSEGRQVGTVSDVVLQPGEERALGFVVDLPGAMSGERFLAFQSVHALGTDAVTIPSDSALSRMGDVANHVAGRSVEGKRVITEAGEVLGVVEDVVLNRADGRIAAYVVGAGRGLGGRQYLFWTENIVTGDDVVVLPSEAVSYLRGDVGGASATWGSLASTEPGGLTPAASAPGGNPETPAALDAEFQFVIGRVAQRDVLLNGEVVVPAGAQVTAADAVGALAAGVLEDLAFAVGLGDPSQTTIHARPEPVENTRPTRPEDEP